METKYFKVCERINLKNNLSELKNYFIELKDR